MTYRFEVRMDRPVLLNTLGPRFEPDAIPVMAAETISLLDRVERRVFYLIDANRLQLGADDVMQGIYAGVLGADPPLRHQNIIETVVVTVDPILRMAAHSISSPLFGHVRITVLPTLDEALAYIDAQVAALRQP